MQPNLWCCRGRVHLGRSWQELKRIAKKNGRFGWRVIFYICGYHKKVFGPHKVFWIFFQQNFQSVEPFFLAFLLMMNSPMCSRRIYITSDVTWWKISLSPMKFWWNCAQVLAMYPDNGEIRVVLLKLQDGFYRINMRYKTTAKYLVPVMIVGTRRVSSRWEKIDVLF